MAVWIASRTQRIAVSVRVKKTVLRQITRDLIRDSRLKCFGKKRKKEYRFIVFDVR